MSIGRLIPFIDSSSSNLNFAPLEIDVSSETMTCGELEDLDSTPHLKVRVSKGADPTTKCWPPSAPDNFAEDPAVSLAFIDENRGEDSLIAIGQPGVRCGPRHIAPEG
jgi:hypothetical protein